MHECEQKDEMSQTLLSALEADGEHLVERSKRLVKKKEVVEM